MMLLVMVLMFYSVDHGVDECVGNGDKKVCSISNDLMMLEIVLFESGSGVGDGDLRWY